MHPQIWLCITHSAFMQTFAGSPFYISGSPEPLKGRCHQLSLVSTILAALQVCGQAVQEAVQGAFQQALDDNVRFDVRANFFTLIAITGVILFWRGIWSMW